MDFYTRYNPAPQVSAQRMGKSMTQQHFKEECDINVIIRRMVQTGEGRVPRPGCLYGEVPQVESLQEAYKVISDAEEGMASLPSSIRDRLGNNPENFLRYLADPANRLEAEKYGLLKPRPVVVPDPVEMDPPKSATS